MAPDNMLNNLTLRAVRQFKKKKPNDRNSPGQSPALKAPKKPKPQHHFVRLLIKNPCNWNHKNSIPLQLYFYFKSTKPQEYWSLRGAYICLDTLFD